MREVCEETGVRVVPDRVTGVYLSPEVRYANGDRAQYVVTAFACTPRPGDVPRVADDESLEVGYHPLDALPDLPRGHRRAHRARRRGAGRRASLPTWPRALARPLVHDHRGVGGGGDACVPWTGDVGDLELLDRFYAAFARGDGAAMAACYAPDATFSDPVFTDLSGTEPGAMWRMLTERSDDLSVEVVDRAAAGGTGSATWVARYTFGQPGRPGQPGDQS